MPAPLTAFDTAAQFVGRHKWLLAGSGVGLAGAGYGFQRGRQDAAGQRGWDRAETIGHHTAAVGLAALAVGVPMGAAAYAGRGLLAGAGASAAKRTAAWYGRGWTAAFNERQLGAVFAHGPVGLTLGGLAGGAIASMTGSSIAMGAGLGVAAGTVAYPVTRAMTSQWRAWGQMGVRGSLAKAGVIGVAAAGAGLAARAAFYEPEYEAEDVAMRDGLGGYEATPLSARLAMMGGTGDVVLGLHNQRH